MTDIGIRKLFAHLFINPYKYGLITIIPVNFLAFESTLFPNPTRCAV